MKRKGILILLLALAVAAAMLASACSKKPQTLEEYAAQNQEINEDIDTATQDSDVNVEIKGNDIIYSYDLSTVDGYSEEVVKNEAVVEALTSALESSADNFSNICTTVQDATGLTGIRVIVKYNFGEEEIISRSYDSNGIIEES